MGLENNENNVEVRIIFRCCKFDIHIHACAHSLTAADIMSSTGDFYRDIVQYRFFFFYNTDMDILLKF